MLLFKILTLGFLLLVAAIVFNLLAARLGLLSWYDLLTRLSSEGRSVFRQLRVWDYAWLFLVYPFLLGLSAWYAARLLHLFHPSS